MNTTFNITPSAWHRLDWLYPLFIVAFAVTLRIVFFNGFFGSDDNTYLARSYQIAQGIWESADYNGALRYGYNIPAAFFIWIFGLNTFSANLWTLLCSIFEIVAVFWFANRYISKRVAIYAALIIATIPLHIALASRIHADSILAFFLTLSFITLYTAEQTRERTTYFVAGLAIGMVFWVKELAAVTFFAIATYPVIARRVDARWIWVIIGGSVMLIGHLLLMWFISGDPFHLVTTVNRQVQSSFIQSGAGEDGIGYYFWYLLAEIKHTWLIGYLSIGALFFWMMRRRHFSEAAMSAIGYVVWWFAALIVVLTFFPTSLNPVRFAMKQSNYLNLFFGPMAILAAVFLEAIPMRTIRTGLLLVIMAGGVALGAMEQAAYRVFTANSRAAIEFARAHPDDWILGSVNNGNMAWIYAVLNNDKDLMDRFGYLRRNLTDIEDETPAIRQKEIGYVVLDRENENWGANKAFVVSDIPECWDFVTRLEPASLGASASFMGFLQSLAGLLPDALSNPGRRLLDRFSRPKSATVFRVNAGNLWCEK